MICYFASWQLTFEFAFSLQTWEGESSLFILPFLPLSGALFNEVCQGFIDHN
jgi:hypothetical protein